MEYDENWKVQLQSEITPNLLEGFLISKIGSSSIREQK